MVLRGGPAFNVSSCSLSPYLQPVVLRVVYDEETQWQQQQFFEHLLVMIAILLETSHKGSVTVMFARL